LLSGQISYDDSDLCAVCLEKACSVAAEGEKLDEKNTPLIVKKNDMFFITLPSIEIYIILAHICFLASSLIDNKGAHPSRRVVWAFLGSQAIGLEIWQSS
jgi:hypothetical protein